MLSVKIQIEEDSTMIAFLWSTEEGTTCPVK